MVGMMKTRLHTGCKTLQLFLGKGSDVDYVNAAAALIRELTGVLRVQVHLDARQLEILYRHPTAGLVQEIHLALLLAGKELAALRSY